MKRAWTLGQRGRRPAAAARGSRCAHARRDRPPDRLVAQALQVVEHVVEHPVALVADGAPVGWVKTACRRHLVPLLQPRCRTFRAPGSELVNGRRPRPSGFPGRCRRRVRASGRRSEPGGRTGSPAWRGRRRRCRNLRCASSSTPSATTFMPSARPMQTTAWTRVADCTSSLQRVTNSRSIFSLSNGIEPQVAEAGIADAEIVERDLHARARAAGPCCGAPRRSSARMAVSVISISSRRGSKPWRARSAPPARRRSRGRRTPRPRR